jgi:hypothetical protein
MVLHYGDLIDGNCLVKIINETKPTEIYNLGAQSHVKVTKFLFAGFNSKSTFFFITEKKIMVTYFGTYPNLFDFVGNDITVYFAFCL